MSLVLLLAIESGHHMQASSIQLAINSKLATEIVVQEEKGTLNFHTLSRSFAFLVMSVHGL